MSIVQADLYGPVVTDLRHVGEIFDAALASEDPRVQNLVANITRRHGKMLRPALVLLVGRALDRLSDDHFVLGAVIEMIHVASLVHDDVLDEAPSRRNTPSANRLIGNEGAVLLGDYIMSQAFRLCCSMRSHEVNDELTDTCRMICLGELLQVSHRHNLDLGEAEYLNIITKKTAWLMRTCGVLGATLSGADPGTVASLGRYGLNLGMAFQITDDLLDLYGSAEEMGKTLGRDLAKGDLTLPLIRFLGTVGGSVRREMVAAIGDGRAVRLERIRDLLRDHDVMADCRRLARSYADRAVSCLEDLPCSDARDALANLADFVSSRCR